MDVDQIYSRENLHNKIESWASTMGFSLKIPSKTIDGYSKLQTDVWYHIMKHMRPKQEVSVIRKNILLNDLKELKDLPNNSIFPLNGVKSRRDLEKCQMYNNLNMQLEEKRENLKLLEKEVQNLASKVFAMEKEKESMMITINEVRKKMSLMEIHLRQIDGSIKNINENLEKVKKIRDIISNREVDQSGICDEIDIEKILDEVEALYHSHNISDLADLDCEAPALWDKIYDCIFLPPSVVETRIIKELKKNNAIMDEFLETSTRIGREQSLPVDLMDEIRGKNIKIFLEKHKFNSEVKNLKKEVNDIKDEKCHDVVTMLHGQPDQNTSIISCNGIGDNKDNLADSLMATLNAKCDRIMKNERYSFLKLKLNELKNNAGSLELDKSTVYEQKKKLLHLNEKIEEKVKIISKFNSVLLNDKYTSIVTEASKELNEAVEKFHQQNLEINGNIFGHGDCSSNKETPPFLSQMKGFIKNEMELLIEFPLERTNENFSSVCPYDMLLKKYWIRTLMYLMDDFKNNSFDSPTDEADDNISTLKTKEIECEHKCVKYRVKIDSTLNSAEKTFEMAVAFSQLMNGDFHDIDELDLNNPSDCEKFLKSLIEKSELLL